MSKLAILKIGDGSFEQGFPVTLQLCEEKNLADFAVSPIAEVSGKLPAAPELWTAYEQWQSCYRQLGLRSRLSAPRKQVTNISVTQDCLQAAQRLRDQLNQWLRSESFRPVREKWLEQLSPQTPVRVILQTEDLRLQHLPWHLWEILDRYVQAELAVSISSFEALSRPKTTNSNSASSSVKILAILGNSAGIDIQADRALLEGLPQAEVCFLVEPERQVLTERLWSQAWDMLFFAGHSTSNSNSSDQSLGEIQINPQESLTIPQLHYALKKAVARGLKLAIFNSCDGLGLARNLADLHLPQMIVMREPVPDRVAQEFLKSFLDSFAQGQPFYIAVREARERLQGLENQFPCATWLPVICQNPAEPSLSWQMFTGQALTEENQPADLPTVAPEHSHPRQPIRLRYSALAKLALYSLATTLATTLAVTAAMLGLRATGLLQSAELRAFDTLMQLRPPEAQDARLLLVTINADERQQYGAELPTIGRLSISDPVLSQVLQKLSSARVIGLDLYRDFPASSPQLATQYRQDNRLIAVCKARYTGGDSIAPPPEIQPEQVGFSDFVPDADGILRRQLLSMTADLIDPGSPCSSPYAFSLQLARRYLQDQQISPHFIDGNLQLDKLQLKRLQAPIGAYQRIDTSGNQILLNYRATASPAQQVTLTQLLTGQVNPAIIQDRIVLVGVIAVDSDDIWITPIDARMAGVTAQAHMVSQLLSAVLDQRPLLRSNPWLDGLWIGVGALVGQMIGWRYHRTGRWWAVWLVVLVAASLGIAVCWGALIAGYWQPLLPAGLALGTGSILSKLPIQLGFNPD